MTLPSPADEPAPGALAWWQRGVVYQIYPRSFADANGDGVGDLRGITERLAYLTWLGIDAVWISPIYPSPMADLGYDITDHTGIDRSSGRSSTSTRWSPKRTASGCGCCSTTSPTTPRSSTPGSPRRERRGTAPGATGTCGVTRRAMAGRRTTGAACSAARRGH